MKKTVDRAASLICGEEYCLHCFLMFKGKEIGHSETSKIYHSYEVQAYLHMNFFF